MAWDDFDYMADMGDWGGGGEYDWGGGQWGGNDWESILASLGMGGEGSGMDTADIGTSMRGISAPEWMAESTPEGGGWRDVLDSIGGAAGKFGGAIGKDVLANPLAAMAGLAGAGIAGSGLAAKTPQMQPAQQQMSPQEQRLAQIMEGEAARSAEDELTLAQKDRAMRQMGANPEMDPTIANAYADAVRQLEEQSIRERGPGAVGGQAGLGDDIFNRAMAELTRRKGESQFRSKEDILAAATGQRATGLGTNLSDISRRAGIAGGAFGQLSGIGSLNAQMQQGSNQFNAAARAADKSARTTGGSQLLGYSLGGLQRR